MKNIISFLSLLLLVIFINNAISQDDSTEIISIPLQKDSVEVIDTNIIKQKLPVKETLSAQDSLLIKQAYPFVMNGDTLFILYARVGSFYPKDRAAAIRKRLDDIMLDPLFEPDSLYLSENEASVDIMYSDIIIMTVIDKDVVLLGKTTKDAAKIYLQKLIVKIKKDTQKKHIIDILIQAGLVILLIVAFYFIFKYLAKLFAVLAKKIENLKGSVFKGFKLKTLKLLDADKETRIALFIFKLFKWFAFILLFYFGLTLLFSIFPASSKYAAILFKFIIKPIEFMWNSFVEYIPNLITIIVIFLATRYLVKFIRFIAEAIEKGDLTIARFHPEWTKPTFYIFRILVYVLMFIAIFPYLPGSSSPIFQGVSAFLAILISISSAGSLSNIMAGILLIYMRSYNIGDRVKIDDVVGDIIEKSLLVTRIRTIKNEDITIPNSKILSHHITNFSTVAKSLGLIVHTTITIGYDAPWKTVSRLLKEAALKTKYILKDPEPFVLQTSLDDFYISYQINAYTDEPNKQALIYSELHENIQECFNNAGVEIMSPHYRALRDGNESTIPK